MKSVVTIAGSDSSGGAGIQADLKTMSALGVFGQSVITAVTAQNTLGVKGVCALDPSFIRAQMDCVFEDICPDAVKIGMIPSARIVEVVAEGLQLHSAKNIVLDPVMVATSGDALSSDDSVHAMVEKLFPIASIITPNIPEAQELVGHSISSEEEMISAAREIQKLGAHSVLIKGGHFSKGANDFLLTQTGEEYWFNHNRVETSNTHGTGCTLSSAIASCLALGYALKDAVAISKIYLTGALINNPNLGKGSGPLNHMWMELGDRKAVFNI